MSVQKPICACVKVKLLHDDLTMVLRVNNDLLRSDPYYLDSNDISNIMAFKNNKNIYEKLIFYKTKIGEKVIKKSWERMKKITNEYELIHTTHTNCNMSIAKYYPLSRSYFKMWEMMHLHDIVPKDSEKPIVTAHLAEGPGGFIEALVNYRKNPRDRVYGITLKSINKDIPGWVNSKMFLDKHSNIKILYGKDGTGNLYNLDNIIDFSNKVGKADLITADGGFDFSLDFNSQEKIVYKLLFCEITTILSTQKVGGNFVCKCFDLFEENSIKLLWVLSLFYNELRITKPVTSRPANSEKYIIGKNFKGITKNQLNKFYYLISNWDKFTFAQIGNTISPHIHLNFVNRLSDYNILNSIYQIENIQKTLKLIHLKENSETIKKYRNIQCNKAIAWCKTYNVMINTECYILKKRKHYKWR